MPVSTWAILSLDHGISEPSYAVFFPSMDPFSPQFSPVWLQHSPQSQIKLFFPKLHSKLKILNHAAFLLDLFSSFEALAANFSISINEYYPPFPIPTGTLTHYYQYMRERERVTMGFLLSQAVLFPPEWLYNNWKRNSPWGKWHNLMTSYSNIILYHLFGGRIYVCNRTMNIPIKIGH